MKKTFFFFLLITIAMFAFNTTARAASQSATVVSQAQVPVVLELSISPTGQSQLRFSNVQPSLISETQAGPMSIYVDVRANVRYQVSEDLSGPLTNSAGDEIPIDHLSFITSAAHSTGTPVPTTAASASSQVIFTSDALGTSDTIRADYTLRVPSSQAAGDYSTRIIYTISSI